MSEEILKMKHEIRLMEIESKRQRAHYEARAQLMQFAATIFVQQINAPLYALIEEIKNEKTI